MPSLLIGCGNSREKKVKEAGVDWSYPLHTIDINPDCKPDHVMDMEAVSHGDCPLPYPDDSFDMIGAYDVLEHWGRQGDFRAWFREMGEYHRVLKPEGEMSVLVPIGDDALVDPGHTRLFSPMWFAMLDQKFYEKATGHAITDYRWLWTRNFEVTHYQQHGNHHFSVMLIKR